MARRLALGLAFRATFAAFGPVAKFAALAIMAFAVLTLALMGLAFGLTLSRTITALAAFALPAITLATVALPTITVATITARL